MESTSYFAKDQSASSPMFSSSPQRPLCTTCKKPMGQGRNELQLSTCNRCKQGKLPTANIESHVLNGINPNSLPQHCTVCRRALGIDGNQSHRCKQFDLNLMPWKCTECNHETLMKYRKSHRCKQSNLNRMPWKCTEGDRTAILLDKISNLLRVMKLQPCRTCGKTKQTGCTQVCGGYKFGSFGPQTSTCGVTGSTAPHPSEAQHEGSGTPSSRIPQQTPTTHSTKIKKKKIRLSRGKKQLPTPNPLVQEKPKERTRSPPPIKYPENCDSKQILKLRPGLRKIPRTTRNCEICDMLMDRKLKECHLRKKQHQSRPGLIFYEPLQTWWTCTICNTTMNLEHQESHIDKKTHQDHLKLLCKITGNASLLNATEVYQETIKIDGDNKTVQVNGGEQDYKDSTYWSCTICKITGLETDPVHQRDAQLHVTGKRHLYALRAGPQSYPPVAQKKPIWNCQICDIVMDKISEESHLRGKSHQAKLNREPEHPRAVKEPNDSHVYLTKQAKTFSKMQTWTCETCEAIMGVDAQKSHQRGKRHQTKLKAEAQSASITISASKRSERYRLGWGHGPHQVKILRRTKNINKIARKRSIANRRKLKYWAQLRRWGVGGADKITRMRNEDEEKKRAREAQKRKRQQKKKRQEAEKKKSQEAQNKKSQEAQNKKRQEAQKKKRQEAQKKAKPSKTRK